MRIAISNVSSVLVSLVLLSACCNARAEDESQGVRFPVLEPGSSGSVAVSTANLTLGGDNNNEAVHLDLELTGTTSSLSLHFPPFSWPGEGVTYPDRHFPELRVTLNGAPTEVASRTVAMFGGADITAEVNAAGFDPFVIASQPIVEPQRGAEAAFTQLQKRGAIEASEGGAYLANWTAGRDVTISFGQGAVQRLGLNYNARPAFHTMSELDADLSLDDYCITRDGLISALGKPTSKNIFYVTENYAIPVGVSGAPRELHVTLAPWVGDPDFPQLLRVFCSADRKPVIAGRSGISHDAAAGADGIVQVLMIRGAPVPGGP